MSTSDRLIPTKNIDATHVTSCRCIRNPILSVVLFKRDDPLSDEPNTEYITWYWNHECGGFGEGHYGMTLEQGKEDFLKRLKFLL